MPKLKINNRYGVVTNRILNDPEMSLRAKGLFAFLQSKPDNWRFSIERISNQTKEGKSAIQAAIKELEKMGYLLRKSVKSSSGKWSGYDYELSDLPLTENPSTEKPLTEKCVTLSKKENSKKEIVKKNIEHATADAGAEEGKQINKILEAFQMKLNPTMNYGNTTQRKAVKDLLKLVGEEKVLKAIEFCSQENGEPYAPVITTPYQMRERWAQIAAHYKRKANNQNNVVFIS